VPTNRYRIHSQRGGIEHKEAERKGYYSDEVARDCEEDRCDCEHTSLAVKIHTVNDFAA
jgi:hypothetical protein